MTAIVDASDRVLGIFTDGDLRRALDRAADLHATRMEEVMTPPCKDRGREHAGRGSAASDGNAPHHVAAGRRRASGRVVGALNVHDLMRAGVV